MADNVQFYFLSEQYFDDFNDSNLMGNKECVNGVPHGRPCFFAFTDKYNSEILWLVPISSKVEKYRRIAQGKIERNGKCDTICFGKMLGQERAFLIQNMCPATREYLTEYRNKQGEPVGIDISTSTEVIKRAKSVLSLQRYGVKLIFPDSLAIYDMLNEAFTYEYEQEQTDGIGLC